MKIEMKRLHIEKKAIRALGIAESFVKTQNQSILVGIVMRSDIVIDGVSYASATIKGDDATDTIINIYENLDRTDINFVILGGLIISMYNIIDIERLWQRLKIPIIGVTFKESEGLDSHIKQVFLDTWKNKLEAYHRLGSREKIKLKTGYDVFIRVKGINTKSAEQALNKFVLQGSIPEPIRVARLIARAKLDIV
tara:strand:- start:785 stop:1369 length:585 start_codon:yes stop_codon:yes gene_type:complete